MARIGSNPGTETAEVSGTFFRDQGSAVPYMALKKSALDMLAIKETIQHGKIRSSTYGAYKVFNFSLKGDAELVESFLDTAEVLYPDKVLRRPEAAKSDLWLNELRGPSERSSGLQRDIQATELLINNMTDSTSRSLLSESKSSPSLQAIFNYSDFVVRDTRAALDDHNELIWRSQELARNADEALEESAQTPSPYLGEEGDIRGQQGELGAAPENPTQFDPNENIDMDGE